MYGAHTRLKFLEGIWAGADRILPVGGILFYDFKLPSSQDIDKVDIRSRKNHLDSMTVDFFPFFGCCHKWFHR